MSGTREHILLAGFKGCGKTTVGRRIAHIDGREFVDLDFFVEGLYGLACGRPAVPFREIFRAVGREGFQALEARAASLLADQARRAPRPMVIALGGGALMNAEAREALRTVGRVVLLRVPFEEILARMRCVGFPAFIRSDDPEAELARIYREREPVYHEQADVLAEVGGLTPSAAARRVLDILKAEG